jgi:hypothetical protein
VVDIIEDETEYLIKVDLPEIKKEEVKVTVEKRWRSRCRKDTDSPRNQKVYF